MTRLVRTSCLLAILSIIIGCKSEPTRDSVAAESVDTIEQLVVVLKSIQDEASAQAARPKLKELSDKFRQLQAQEKQLGEATKEQRDELKKYDTRNEKALKEMIDQNARIRSDPKLSGALDELKLEEPATP